MTLDKSAYTLTYAEDGTRPHPERRSRTAYESGVQAGWGSWNSRNLSGNGEMQVYVDPAWTGQCSSAPGWNPPPLGLNPFSAGDGAVHIVADRLPPALAAGQKAAEGLPAGLKYTSGLLTTAGRFSQTYGHFEADVMFSGGRGLWPAIWLLADDNHWPPELDVMEVLGHDPTTVYCTAHRADASGAHVQTPTGAPIKTPDPTLGFVTYGLEWLPSGLRWFVNGEVVKTAGPEFSPAKPMHLLANLAVGGTWPGAPDAATQFPATMSLRMRAYRINP